MRAACFGEFGAPSVLRVGQRPGPPAPHGDQLLVRVHASSVNGVDLALRRGDLKVATWGRMPFVPGFDVAGQVSACGPQVTAFRPGDRVMALVGHGGGGHADEIVLPQRRAARVPDAVATTDAAALPLAGLTALQALYGLARLPARSAPRVLVLGASGGVGSFAVQLARLAGAHVTAVTTTGATDFVAGLGAHLVVDRTREHPARIDESWDVAFDASGRWDFRTVRPLLRRGGTMVSVRPVSSDAVRALARGRGRRFVAVRTRARATDLAHLGGLVERGDLRVPVDREFALTAVADAHRHAEDGALGKVVVGLLDGP